MNGKEDKNHSRPLCRTPLLQTWLLCVRHTRGLR